MKSDANIKNVENTIMGMQGIDSGSNVKMHAENERNLAKIRSNVNCKISF